MNTTKKIIKVDGGVDIHAWTNNITIEPQAMELLQKVATLPIIHSHIAVMPDVHWGVGSCIGSVIPTIDAIIPAAVGMDIGCGMMAMKLNITIDDIPPEMRPHIRGCLETYIPNGRTDNGGKSDKGAWGTIPEDIMDVWEYKLKQGWEELKSKYPDIETQYKVNTVRHLGSLGTGNHFLEICTDEDNSVWIMLHSGSRGVGGRIGSYFTKLAKKTYDANKYGELPHPDLAYFTKDGDAYYDYLNAAEWAQGYAEINRKIMMGDALKVLQIYIPHVKPAMPAISCHHNYVCEQEYNDESILVTRKGAISAKHGEMGIIPGSMGAKSYIVAGMGEVSSFCSASHGAGRAMGRKEAKRRFTVDEHIKSTEGIECRKDASVLDETPMAYKDIDMVIAAEADLVTPVHTLKQIICVKG